MFGARRITLLAGLALLLSSCGVGGDESTAILYPIGDQTTLVDEPLVVALTVTPGTKTVEAAADDPAGVLSSRPAVEGTSTVRTLHLEPSSLATGEAQITVTAATDSSSDSETFRFEVVPPYRSLAQVFRPTDEGNTLGYRLAPLAVEGDVLVSGSIFSPNGPLESAGAVFVFELGAEGWRLVAELRPSDPQAKQYFGSAVDMSGDWIIVGARGDDDVATNAGAAYIFEFDGAEWVQVLKLLPASAGGTNQHFGEAVAINEEYAIVGAPRADSGGLVDNGQVYVHRRAGDSWRRVAALTNSDASSDDELGARLALQGSEVVTVTPGTHYPSPGNYDGAAYLFELQEDNSWSQTAKLTPVVPVSQDSFGSALAFRDDTIVVGARHTSIDGALPGAIYVFERSTGNFDTVTKLVTGEDAEDTLGSAVAFSGHYLLSRAVIDGEERLFLFKRNGDSWAQVNSIPATALQSEEIGYSMVLTQEHAVLTGSVAGVSSFLYLPRWR